MGKSCFAIGHYRISADRNGFLPRVAMTSSLYVHIPYCLAKCDYCDFYSVPTGRVAPPDAFVDALLLELGNKAKRYRVSAWNTVYIGGGTPSLLSPDAVERLCSAIRANCAVNAEWTIEANPETLTENWLLACQSGGINRLSLGIQSMRDESLAATGRHCSREANVRALDMISRVWKGRLSVDLIAGLPNQDANILLEDLSQVLSYNPDHVSLYALTVESGTPLARRLAVGETVVPEASEADDIWIAGRDFLINHGFSQYEVSNFALPGHESAHNRVYWAMGDWIGIGPGASGTISSGDTARRETNPNDVHEWLGDPAGCAEREPLSRAECIEECLLMGFRQRAGISLDGFAARFGVELAALIPHTIAKWQALGTLAIEKGHCALTSPGLLVLNRFLADCVSELSSE
jgi:oxygen-independent coproporphyrinogen-3 oxidase